MILSGFIITIGGINKESISLIQHLKMFMEVKTSRKVEKEKKRKRKKTIWIGPNTDPK